MPFEVDTQQVTDAAHDMAAARDRVTRALQPTQLTDALRPLRDDIAGAWTGPYARVLANATTVQTSPALAVVTGGSAPVLSGGGTASDVVFGVMFGGGRRVGSVRSTSRRRAHRRRTTAQFKAQTLAADKGAQRGMDAAAVNVADTVQAALVGS